MNLDDEVSDLLGLWKKRHDALTPDAEGLTEGSSSHLRTVRFVLNQCMEDLSRATDVPIPT
jgi:hypothetical protein